MARSHEALFYKPISKSTHLTLLKATTVPTLLTSPMKIRHCTLIFFLSWITVSDLTNASAEETNGGEYVKDACRVTKYPDLCVHSLSSYSNTKRNPSLWARAGISVTLNETERVAEFLAEVKMNGQMSRRNAAALSDCIECFDTAIDELHRSLAEMREMSKSAFVDQMGDLVTWMSAVLTDEDTCLDGFEGENGRQVSSVRDRVMNVYYMTSNALALVNRFADTGF